MPYPKDGPVGRATSPAPCGAFEFARHRVQEVHDAQSQAPWSPRCWRRRAAGRPPRPAQPSSKPLTEAEIVRFGNLKAKPNDDIFASMIREVGGVDFTADKEMLERLEERGVSKVVLEAVRELAPRSRRPAPRSRPAPPPSPSPTRMWWSC